MILTRHLRYRFEALAAGTPRLYSLMLRSFAAPASLKLLFVNAVKRGDVVFDVGANRGIFTSYFSNLVGARGSVHAFEPSSKTCEMLRASLLMRTRHNNVVVNCCAVGHERGAALLHTPSSDDGQASLVEHSDGSWCCAAEVHIEPCEIVTLDEYLEDRQLGRVDFVKVDVEGAERLVVSGFLKGLRQFRPLLVLELCSRWSKDFGYRPAELLMTLQELGYDRFDEVGKSGRLIELGNADRLDASEESVDVVCSVSLTHDSRLSRFRSTRRSAGTSRKRFRRNR
jgi:FkbM family methyltransferase